MGLIGNILNAFKATRRPPNDGEQRYIGASIRTGEEITGRYDTTNPRDMASVARAVSGSIFNAASLISRAAARGEIKLYRASSGKARKGYAQDDDESEEVTDHPALDILRDPDPSMSCSDVLQMIYWYREVCGHCYIWTGGATPTGLYILHPQWTRPVLSKTEGVTEYNYGRENMRPLRVPSAEVVVSKWMVDPVAPWQGTSWVRSIERYADLEDAAVTAELARWRNSGQYGSVFKAPGNWTLDKIKQAESLLRSKGGPLAAGKALVVQDLEMVQSATKPHEMNYLPGLQQAEAAIYRAAGVPDPIWKMNDAIQSNAAEGGLQWQRAIYERQCRVAEDLTEWFLPMFGVEPGEMWFEYENPVEEDKDAEAARLAVACPQLIALSAQVADKRMPVETAVAIARATFPDLEEEEIDGIFAPLANFSAPAPVQNLFGAMTNGQGKPAAETQTGGGNDSGGRGEGGAPDAGGDRKPKDAGNDPGAKARGNAAGLGRKAGKVELIHVPRWGAFCSCGCAHKAADTTDPIEARIFRAVQDWANDALTRGIAGIGPDGSFDISKLASAELESVLRASITAAFDAGAVSFIEEQGVDTEPLTSEAAREYVQGYTFELVKGVTETMADQMRTVIDDGLAKGQTINEIQQQLTDRVPEVSLARAETIARTETARAAQNGALAQAKELGFEGKQWLLSGNPCGLCEGAAAALAGTTTLIGEPFFAAGTTIVGTDGKTYTVSRPIMAACELHPQCNCTHTTVQETAQ